MGPITAMLLTTIALVAGIPADIDGSAPGRLGRSLSDTVGVHVRRRAARRRLHRSCDNASSSLLHFDETGVHDKRSEHADTRQPGYGPSKTPHTTKPTSVFNVTAFGSHLDV
jgi:hypothetical protein